MKPVQEQPKQWLIAVFVGKNRDFRLYLQAMRKWLTRETGNGGHVNG